MSDSFSIVTHKESVDGWHLHMMGGEFWSSMTDQERCAVIAAVPDMLEALKGMCDAYKELCLMSGYNFHQSGGSRYTAARAALAKAEAKS